ncbi:MAG: hypothetical protein P1P89_04780 [Desulfobacterales bacterium]|nr:hypothetical protein [Desulfobacterales bacterium]
MDNVIRAGQTWDLKEMHAKIAEIELRINELRDLGIGLPAVEKNTRSMLNYIYVLKFGISDIFDMENN